MSNYLGRVQNTSKGNNIMAIVMSMRCFHCSNQATVCVSNEDDYPVSGATRVQYRYDCPHCNQSTVYSPGIQGADILEGDPCPEGSIIGTKMPAVSNPSE